MKVNGKNFLDVVCHGCGTRSIYKRITGLLGYFPFSLRPLVPIVKDLRIILDS